MRSDETTRTPSTVVALERIGERFVEVTDNSLSPVERSYSSRMLAYLRHHHKQVRAQCEISGRSYVTTVFESLTNDDHSFVIADRFLVPIEHAETGPTIDPETIRDYLRALDNKFCYSESLLPQQATYLWSQFIQPEFVRLRSIYDSGDKTLPWESILGLSKIMMLGEPGSGKTSCLRRLALEFADPDSHGAHQDRIPVYYMLRELSDTRILLDSLRQYVRSLRGHWIADRFDLLLTDGKIVLILDGLDELEVAKRAIASNAIAELVKKFPRMSVIVSSRRSSYTWDLPDFTHVEIKPFDKSQIKFWSVQKIARKPLWKTFITHLFGMADLLEAASNPLMLSISTFLFERNSLLPIMQAHILSEFVRALVEDWDANRGVNRLSSEWANPSRILLTLGRLSYEARSGGKQYFTNDDASVWLGQSQDRHTTKQTLQILSDQTGLVRQSSENTWAFTRKAYLDYLASRYIVDRTAGITNDLLKHGSVEQWRDIWSNVCGLTSDPENIINFVIKNKNTDRYARAIQLIRILHQVIDLKRDALEEACTTFVQDLEHIGGELKIIKMTKDKVEKYSDLREWSVSLCQIHKHKEATTTGLEKFGAIIRDLHLSRSSSAKHLLFDLLSNSKVDLVRYLSYCLNQEGHLFYVIINSPTGEQSLSMRIEPESPGISNA